MSRRPIVPGIHTGQEGDEPAGELDLRFRDAMARWPSGVTVVAVRDERAIVGLTVSAFSSLSRDPPLLLVCLGDHTGLLPELQEGVPFGVSILSEGQRRLASAFARGVPVDPEAFTEGDAPLVEGAPAAFRCTVENVVPGGDHYIVVGRVDDAVLGPEDEPLVHHRRDYRSLQP